MGFLLGAFTGVAAGRGTDLDGERFQGGGTASSWTTLGQARSGGLRCSGGVSVSSICLFSAGWWSLANPVIGFGGRCDAPGAQREGAGEAIEAGGAEVID